VIARRADAEDGAVPFRVTAFLGDTSKADTAAAGTVVEAIVAAARLLQDLTPLLAPLASHCIPARKDPLMTGTAFMKLVAGAKTVADRDKEALKQILDGNIPDFLRSFVAVNVKAGSDTGVVFVAPDYLAIGTDADFVRIPLLPGTAQKAVSGCCCLLPTAKLTDDIFAAATTRIDPVSVTNTPGVQNAEVIASNKAIEAALAKAAGYKRGDLTTGPKKDIVLSLFLKRLALKGKDIMIFDKKAGKLVPSGHKHQADDAVVIYGWHQPSNKGIPIQGEFDGHDKNYEDYSHGTRLVSNKMLVNGSMEDVAVVLKDKALAPLICRATDVADPDFPLPDHYP